MEADGDDEERVADDEVKVRAFMTQFSKTSDDPFLWQAPLATQSAIKNTYSPTESYILRTYSIHIQYIT